MVRRVKYRRRSNSRSKKILGGKFVWLVLVSLVIIGVSSSYVYLRVWMRDLDIQIRNQKTRNEKAERYLDDLKSEWAVASSLVNIEKSVSAMNLGLRPTSPTQNLVLYPESTLDKNRYAGLLKAFHKIKKSLPVVSGNEAEANQLFEGK